MSLWSQAAKLADQTPESRNRYVDFLRALSILAVVLGHWVMAGPHYADGTAGLDHLLDVSPWTRWLTWLFQVMPVFFFVGGYSNGTSWDGAIAKGVPYRQWLGTRMRRLLAPALPLLALWAALAIVGHQLGVPRGFVRLGSQVSLVPVWFLAVYLLVVMFVPATRAAWRRFGMWSFFVPVAAAALNDLAFFAAGLEWVGWLNYLFVWLAVHQLGYAWREGKLSGVERAMPFLLVGLPALVAMTKLGPYPLSLVGVPSEGISNTLPPKLPLLALGAAQIGLLLSLEAPMRRWLARPAVWTATVLINGTIMTIFLWHSTAMMLLIGLGFWLVPEVHATAPGSAAWWALRPLWVLAYALASLPFVALFVRFERGAMRGAERVVAGWRLFAGTIAICLGLALLAISGVGDDNRLGLAVVPVLLPFIGAALAGFGPLARLLPFTTTR